MYLPAEIRIMIYNEALYYPGGLEWQRRSCEPDEYAGYFRPLSDSYRFPEDAIALPYVSKTIMNESLALVYEINDLHFGKTPFRGPPTYEKPPSFPNNYYLTGHGIDACLFFLRSLPIPSLHNLNRTRIWMDFFQSPEHLGPHMARIADEFPDVKVGLHHRTLRIRPDMDLGGASKFVEHCQDWERAWRRISGPWKMYLYVESGVGLEKYRPPVLSAAQYGKLMHWCENGIAPAVGLDGGG